VLIAVKTTLLLLRLAVFVVMLVWTVDKFIRPDFSTVFVSKSAGGLPPPHCKVGFHPMAETYLR
jgi:hypothetical protein